MFRRKPAHNALKAIGVDWRAEEAERQVLDFKEMPDTRRPLVCADRSCRAQLEAVSCAC